MSSMKAVHEFRRYAGPAFEILIRDPVRLRDATDRFALRLVCNGRKYNTARRYASEVLAAYGARRPVGRPAGVDDVWGDS